MRYSQIVPYLTELREVADSALYQYSRIEDAARRWLEIDMQFEEEARLAFRIIDDDEFATKLTESATRQTHIAEELGGFFATWNRLSSLLFPSIGEGERGELRRERGAELRRLLGLRETSLLNSRPLRDAWMHFDARLDRAVLDGYWATSRQRFARALEAQQLKANALYLMEVDTFVIHYRDDAGAHCADSLRAIAAALDELRERIPSAWTNLRSESSSADDTGESAE